MGFFKENRNQYLDEFDEEQRLYEAAAKEFDDGDSHPELRARVLHEAHESLDFARTRFIEERVQMLLAEKESATEGTVRDLAGTESEHSMVASPTTSEQVSPAVSREQAKKLGGYFSVLSGLAMLAIAFLYLSLGGIKTGLSFLATGVAALSVGIMLLKFFTKPGEAG